MTFTLFGLHFTSAVLVLGVILGMTYGILAVGLVLVFRSSKVINFAHGEIGAFGAAVGGLAIVRWHLPYWVAFLGVVLVSASIGGVTEVAVVRRLRNAPKLMSILATVGVAEFLIALSSVVNNSVSAGTAFPKPPGLPQFHIGVLLVTQAYSAMLVFSPLVVIGLVLFFRYSRFGLALRAAAANEERARVLGVSARKMSTLAWMIAGGIAGMTTMFFIPTRGFLTAEVLGPPLLLRALVPAVLARMNSLPVALAAGVGVGIIDELLVYNYPTSGIGEFVLLAIIIVALLARPGRGGRAAEREDWSALQPWAPLPDAFKAVRAIRNLGWIVTAVAVPVAITVGLVVTNSAAVTLIALVAFSLLGLSIGIVTGLTGQLSIGQFALAGVAATASFEVTSRGGNFLFGLVAAAIVTAVVSLLLGLPALRVRGLLLAVTTLGFALAARDWLLSQSWALGVGASTPALSIGPIHLSTTKRYYFYALAVFGIGMLLARNVWRGGVGLRLRAQRDNEDAARAFGVSVTNVKLQGFAIAGIVAGLGGAVYGNLLSRITAQTFDVVTSINVVALSVLGGIGLLAGPLLGALYIIGLPRFLPLDSAGVAASALGWLVLILYVPGGVAQLLAVPRKRLIDWLARRAGLDPDAIRAGASDVQAAVPRRALEAAESGTAPPQDRRLTVEGLAKQFGGVHAVEDVSFSAVPGEILGIIGPNGAGKTTLFELISGFTKPDAGRVLFAGQDITRLAPEERARRGLVRSFQDCSLFPTLTVLEVVTLAFERVEPTRSLTSALGWQGPERHRTQRARDLVALMGLDSFRDKQTRELSTGTRRITELACVVAMRPVLLLLDEPSSGIAQRESEALGDVLLGLRDHLDATFLIIEHDIPLLTRLAGRMIAMDTGRIISVGTPAEVRADPLVVESYLGGDVRAIERSGQLNAAAAVEGDQCRAVTRARQRCSRRARFDGMCGTHAQQTAGSR